MSRVNYQLLDYTSLPRLGSLAEFRMSKASLCPALHGRYPRGRHAEYARLILLEVYASLAMYGFVSTSHIDKRYISLPISMVAPKPPQSIKTRCSAKTQSSTEGFCFLFSVHSQHVSKEE